MRPEAERVIGPMPLTSPAGSQEVLVHHQLRRALGYTALSLILLQAPAEAQTYPSVEKRVASSHPATPAGWKQTCIQGPDTGAPSTDCPVLVWGDYTYWAWSDSNNDNTMAIVAYDATGKAVKQWVKPGLRYIWQITLDEAKETVTFVGQSSRAATMRWDELEIDPPPPGELTVVEVDASALACVFGASCAVTPNDTSADIPMPQGVSGKGRRNTRTFVGAAGTPGAGKTAYQYQVDMTEAVSSWTVPCVTDLTVDFGPVAQLPYGPGGSQDIFVITSGTGVTGTVKLYEAQKRGNAILFTFNQPVCAGSTAPGTGISTFFVGVASNGAPRAVTAKVGWPGLEGLSVGARAPAN
jgi:hypothetical protein